MDSHPIVVNVVMSNKNKNEIVAKKKVVRASMSQRFSSSLECTYDSINYSDVKK